MIKKVFVSILTVITITSCGSINPATPEIFISQDVKLPPQELSSISIPIKINLAPYFKDTEKSVPKEFTGSEQTCEGVSFSYKFIRNPIIFEGAGNAIQFDVDGKYALNLNYCPQCTDLFNKKGNCVVPRIYASCGVDEPMRKMFVSYESEIGLTNDYKLTSKTKLKEVKAKTPCKITVFDYNATETLEDEVKKALKVVEKDIDKEIASIDLRPDMQEAWDALSIASDLEGYGFLYLNPKSISLSKIKYEGDTAFFDIVLNAKPIISLTEKEQKTTGLPKLAKYTPKEGFDINMDIFATYDSLSSIISNEIKGTKTEVKGKEVIFENVRIFGASGNKLSIQVDFDGKKKGILYLVGTPSFDSEKQFISFPDLEFDVETKSALLKSAKWLFDGKITELLRSSAQIDLKPYLNELKSTLNQDLKMELTEGVFMDGKIGDITITSIIPKMSELFIRINSKGTLSITM